MRSGCKPERIPAIILNETIMDDAPALGLCVEVVRFARGSTVFTVGKEYHRRSEIHDVYGGQQQGGISTPKNHPMVFLFASEAGDQHGYRDEFKDGIFFYTGAGQVGDMAFTGGNRAIAYHRENGKTLHLFEYTRRGYVRYVGEADCIGHHQEERPDRNGALRQALVFHLDLDSSPASLAVKELPALYDAGNVKPLKHYSLEQLRDAASPKAVSASAPQTRVQVAYYRAEAIRRYALARAKGSCEGCTQPAPFASSQGPYLECHHLHRIADGGPDHPENVIALCPNCHRRAHYAKDAASFNAQLVTVVKAAEAAL